jgi:hypothetical protein
MENILYKVSKNLYNLEIQEITYIKKTDSFYWTSESRRDALNTNYCKIFENKQDAINYIKYLIQSDIDRANSSLKYANDKMDKFNNIYNK